MHAGHSLDITSIYADARDAYLSKNKMKYFVGSGGVNPLLSIRAPRPHLCNFGRTE